MQINAKCFKPGRTNPKGREITQPEVFRVPSCYFVDRLLAFSRKGSSRKVRKANSQSTVLSLKLGFCILLACAGITASAQTNDPIVTKVEPPSWWAGHSINPVRPLARSIAGGMPREVLAAKDELKRG